MHRRRPDAAAIDERRSGKTATTSRHLTGGSNAAAVAALVGGAGVAVGEVNLVENAVYTDTVPTCSNAPLLQDHILYRRLLLLMLSTFLLTVSGHG